jgi:2-amino-4-hydroxy-6-hydroxymethyldihydropteridine diphosphokinase
MKLAVGLGSSLGDRRARLEHALVKLAHTPGLHLLRASRWVRTPPLHGGTAKGWFLNGVAAFASELTPEAVLDVCVALEEQAGRRRARVWGDRTLDLDVLLADDLVVDSERLVLPHPAIGRRRFVLEPLLEVWPDAVDPRTGQAYADLPTPAGPRPVPWGVVARGRPLRYL